MIKIRLITVLMCILTGFLNSCIMHDELDDCPQNKELKVKATLEFGKDSTNIAWPKGSSIGITVFRAGTNNCFGNNSDKKYMISDPNSGDSNPDEANDPIYLPDDGSNADIIAYYPYSTPFDQTFNALLKVTDQSIQDSLDLITSDRECNIRPDAEQIHLKFYRRLSKMKFNITLIEVDANGKETVINEQLPGTKLQISGTPGTGNYFLPENKLTPDGAFQTIESLINQAGTRAEAIVFPRPAGEGVEFLVTLPNGTKKTYKMDPELVLQAGMEHQFEIVVKVKKDTPVVEPEYKITYELQGKLTSDNIVVKQGTYNTSWSQSQTITVKKGSNFSFLYNSELAVTAYLPDGTVLDTQNNTAYSFTNINKDIHIILTTPKDSEPPVPGSYKITYELRGDLTAQNIVVSQSSDHSLWNSAQVISVKEGDNFSFSYNSTLSVSAKLSDETTLSMKNNTLYTFTNIRKDIHIILSATKEEEPDVPTPDPNPGDPVDPEPDKPGGWEDNEEDFISAEVIPWELLDPVEDTIVPDK